MVTACVALSAPTIAAAQSNTLRVKIKTRRGIQPQDALRLSYEYALCSHTVRQFIRFHHLYAYTRVHSRLTFARYHDYR